MGEQVSYANLVAHFTGHQVDKGARFTDWARRPLSDRQLVYAIADVTYLAEIFPKMLAKLKKTGRGEWLDEEMARATDPSNYVADPEQVWQRVKLPNRKPEVLGRLKALARWREYEARDKNVPRGRIVKDETLADLAAGPPASQSELGRVRGLSAAWGSNGIGERLMEALAGATPMAADEIPVKDGRPGLSTDAGLVADLLKLLLKIRCKEQGVAPRLVARTEELELLAAGQREGLAILGGWRRALVGADCLDLVEGRLGFSVENGALRMRPLAPVAADAPGTTAPAIPAPGITAPGITAPVPASPPPPAPAPAPKPDVVAAPPRRTAPKRRAPG